MKKRLTRKLFLSLAAMGVTAATLTTSTFAWYTGNSEAKVNTVGGSTAASGESAIYIASATDYSTAAWTNYTPEVKPKYTNGFDSASDPSDTNKAPVLKPVFANLKAISEVTDKQVAVEKNSYVKIHKTEAVANSNDTVYYAAEDKSDFVEFVIRVRGTNVAANTKLYFKEFTLANTQTDLPTQIALANDSATDAGTTGVAQAGPYGADLLKALKMDIYSAPVTITNNVISTDFTTGRASASSKSTYQFETFTGLKNDINISKTGTSPNEVAAPNAIGYYNVVTGSNVAAPSSNGDTPDYNPGTPLYNVTAGAGTALEVATLTESAAATAVVEIRFVVYLDGWDNYCYDVMQGQGVTLSFKLTTKSEESVISTAAAA